MQWKRKDRVEHTEKGRKEERKKGVETMAKRQPNTLENIGKRCDRSKEVENNEG